MDRWILSLPTKVEFGEGALSSLKDHAAGYKKALVVTGRNAMRKAGVTDRVCALLKEAGVDSVVFTDVSPDPDCTEVSRAGEIVRAENIDLLVAVGGGSAIDCAKAVSVIATNPGEPMDYVMGTGTRKVENDCLPIIAVSSVGPLQKHQAHHPFRQDLSQGGHLRPGGSENNAPERHRRHRFRRVHPRFRGLPLLRGEPHGQRLRHGSDKDYFENASGGVQRRVEP